MKREAIAAQTKAGKFKCPPDKVLERLPRLAEAVADLFWDDGSPRQPYTLSVNWESGSCLLQLNDKEQGRSVAVTAVGIQEAMQMLEDLLTQGHLPWRKWAPQKGRRA